MAILDGGDEIGIGLDLGGKLVAHDLDQIAAGLAVGQTLLSPDFGPTSEICFVQS